MSLAIAIHTESGDDFLFAIDEKDTISGEELTSFLKENIPYQYSEIASINIQNSKGNRVEYPSSVFENIYKAYDEQFS